MMARADLTLPTDQTRLPRSISQTLRDQVHITTSGIFTRPPLEAALATFGLDNILFSVDYPYAPNKPGHEFLAGLQLPPADLAKLAYANADRLLKL
jgi:predicted TIM-barrel fold metal-dependent hydrolase